MATRSVMTNPNATIIVVAILDINVKVRTIFSKLERPPADSPLTGSFDPLPGPGTVGSVGSLIAGGKLSFISFISSNFAAGSNKHLKLIFGGVFWSVQIAHSTVCDFFHINRA